MTINTLEQTAAPLVRIEIGDVRTSEPQPGQYYETADGRLLMCISRRHSAGRYVYWFIDAADSPLTILGEEELHASPLAEVDLVPTGREAQ